MGVLRPKALINSRQSRAGKKKKSEPSEPNTANRNRIRSIHAKFETRTQCGQLSHFQQLSLKKCLFFSKMYVSGVFPAPRFDGSSGPRKAPGSENSYTNQAGMSCRISNLLRQIQGGPTCSQFGIESARG